jgi:hypothetical protein
MRENSEIPDFVFAMADGLDITFPEIGELIPKIYAVEIMECDTNIIRYKPIGSTMNNSILIDKRNYK